MAGPVQREAGRGGWRVRAAAGALLLCLAAPGCASPSLDRARSRFADGDAASAVAAVGEQPVPRHDPALFLLERGTMLQAQGRFEESNRDFLDAYERLGELETYSLSRGGASWVANDNVQEYRGAPFERVLLHTLTAMNHLALGHWEHAGVEARRILTALDDPRRADYPDDAFSRYTAGVGLEVCGDRGNAAVTYARAAALSPDAGVDPDTGRTPPQAEAGAFGELVCLIGGGAAPGSAGSRARTARVSSPPKAVLEHAGEVVGTARLLTDTAQLAFTTSQLEEARRVAKTVGRVVAKEVLAETVSAFSNELMGDLVRLVLIGLLERPDTRAWETLPGWFLVARVPCPSDPRAWVLKVTAPGSDTTTRTIPLGEVLHRVGDLSVAVIHLAPAGPSTPVP